MRRSFSRRGSRRTSNGSTPAEVPANQQECTSPESPKTSSQLNQSRLVRSDSEVSLVTKRKNLDNGYHDSVHCDDKTGGFLCHKEGYLKKQNRRGRFQRRYFATNNAYLNYYSQKSTYSSGDRSLVAASIDLRAAATICLLSHNGKATKKFAIQTRQGDGLQEDCFFLKAKSIDEAVEWVRILKMRRDYWSANEETKQKIRNGMLIQEEKPKDYNISTQTAGGSDDGAWWQESSEKNGSSDDSSDDLEDDEGFMTGQEDSNDEDESMEDEVKGEEDERNIPKLYLSYEEQCIYRLRTIPKPLTNQFWREPDVRKLRIRGKTYMEDSQKIQATEPLFKLIATDLYKTDSRVDHIASDTTNRIQRARSRGDKIPFIFIANIQVPGPPFYSHVSYFAATKQTCDLLLNDGSVEGFPPGFPSLAKRAFLSEDNELRDIRFKLCQRIVEGPFVVRHGVPNKPIILGRKLKQRYFQGENYLEIDIDIGSSLVAWKLTQMCVGFAKLLTIDLAFVLQGNREEELPEQVIGYADEDIKNTRIGCVRCNIKDCFFDKCTSLGLLGANAN